MTDRVSLSVPAGGRFETVVDLVLGGLGLRLDLPVDRIDDLGLAVASAGSAVSGEQLRLEASVLDGALQIAVGPLRDGAASDPARRRLIDPLVDTVDVVEVDGGEWLTLGLHRGER